METPMKMKLFKFCSMLMALLFLYSASVQLNDPDWYFWFPLYALASVVNLNQNRIKKSAKLTLCLGLFLFVKVILEDFVSDTAGFLSLDLSERVVREKIGSGLVVISMLLHIQASSSTDFGNKKLEPGKYVQHGMELLVVISYGLPLVFFVIQKGEIKL